jgi:hypothetical protein
MQCDVRLIGKCTLENYHKNENYKNICVLRRSLSSNFHRMLASPVAPRRCNIACRTVNIIYIVPIYDVFNARGLALRIPSTRGVRACCVLGAMFLAIVASRVYKKMASVIAHNKSITHVLLWLWSLLGDTPSLLASEAMSYEYPNVGLTLIIRKLFIVSPSLFLWCCR